MRGASGRECNLRATCVQKTLCSDLSQIKYVRWNSAFMEHGAFIGFRGLPTKAGRAMEIGIGNALLHVYHPSFALRNDSAYERLAAFARSPNGGLIVTASTSALVHRDLITMLAARHRLPAVYPYRFFVTAGGLISYGPDTTDPFRRAAGYVDRILKGEK